MSDYYFETGVSRDQMANALADNIEQTPYVLAEFADSCSPGTSDFDDFLDQTAALDDEQRANLWHFFSRAANQMNEGANA